MAVEVDSVIGEVEVLDYVAVHDSGTIINPQIVEEQIEGGIFHGFAGALYEELEYDDNGTLQADTFMDYDVPTAKEAPEIDTDHLETPSPKTPLGSKDTGEAVPAVIANAVDNALDPADIKITSLPLKSQYVWNLLNDSSPESGAD